MRIARRPGRRLQRCAGGLAAALVLAIPQQAYGLEYPVKPILLVVPTGPDGGTDLAARTIAPRLGQHLGQQVTVENRPGAATMLGSEFVARATPDGYTLLMGISSIAINPYIQRSVPYDAVRDFAPVTQVVSVPNLLVTHPSLPVRSLKEFVEFVRERPVKVTFAAGSPGSNAHLAMELFAHLLRLRMVFVAASNQGLALPGVIAGHVPVMMASMPGALPHVRNQRLRAQAVSGPKRARVLPDVPTIAEGGVPDYSVVQWFGILAPAGTPREIIGMLHAAAARVLDEAAVRQRFTEEGSEAIGNTPEEFAAAIRADLEKWGRVIREVNIRWE
jgi:tripartite-type tricarboxylate transporter receptor subunit TctC